MPSGTVRSPGKERAARDALEPSVPGRPRMPGNLFVSIRIPDENPFPSHQKECMSMYRGFIALGILVSLTTACSETVTSAGGGTAPDADLFCTIP